MPESVGETAVDESPTESVDEVLKEQHLVFHENQRGVSFDTLFGPYLKDASNIVVTDPYIRHFYQVRNFMELARDHCQT